jgi:hypothetical protein
MYNVLIAVLLMSTRMGLARGHNINPSLNLLLNANSLAAERLDWMTPLLEKDDQSTMLNVCGTFRHNKTMLTC